MTKRMADDYLEAIKDLLLHEIDRPIAHEQLRLAFAELDRARANEDTGELEAAWLQLQAAYNIIDALLDYTSCRTDDTCRLCGDGDGHQNDCTNVFGWEWQKENEAYYTD